jgi:hypothetical protein
MIRLIPNTGIQYVALPEIPLERLRKHDFALRRGQQFHQVQPDGPSRQSLDPLDGYESEATGFRKRSADMVLIDQLLGAFPEGLWLPLPFEGGSLWVSAFLRKSISDRGTAQVAVTLAVDTTLECDGNPDGVAPEELGDRAPFPCSLRFWRHRAVQARLASLSQSLPSQRSRPEEQLEQLQVAIAGLADLFARLGHARIALERRPQNGDAVVVNMMLDLGNSRTCVLLSEQEQGGRRLGLELRYPDDPSRVEVGPFSTQSAFVEHEIIPVGVGETVSFRFLSIVKLGSGALDALARRDQDPRPLGISTPKRYLWEDYGKVDWTWRFANRLDAQRMSPPIRGDMVRRMDPGNVFQPPMLLPDLVQPEHPRVASMVWTIVELLEQAFRQINAPAWRRTAEQAPGHDRRRIIGNLVVTYPAGLHSHELRNFERAVAYACKMWSDFRSSPAEFCAGMGAVSVDERHGVPRPRVQMICDEGMAIQLSWLYGESVHRFGADAKGLIDALGRRRLDPEAPPESPAVPTLRIGSIDIGGGTVDLAVADYRVHEGLNATVAFDCDRLFHDSISRAGDDVMRGILERHVFPAIVRESKCGAEAWNRIFAVSASPDDRLRELRRKLVRAAWIPITMALLERIEKSPGPASSSEVSVSVRIGDACRSSRLLFELSEAVRTAGASGGAAQGTPLEDIEVRMSRAEMREIVRGTIGKTIGQCADIVDQFDCDLLIVGGRPSGNPEVREQIYASMAVPPGQVVFLSELAVDDWYPFADGTSRIGDAKTCAVVGAAVAFAGQYGLAGLGSFFLEFKGRDEPAPIIGYIRNAGAIAEPRFDDAYVLQFGADAEPVSFPPLQPLVIACRRVDSPEAEARPIYRVRLRPQLLAELQRTPVLQSDVKVTFNLMRPEHRTRGDINVVRPPALHDELEFRNQQGTVLRRGPGGQPQEIDAAKALELKPCSLLESEGYWIDTGAFHRQDPGAA